jgi:hypothetical protein
MEIAFAGLHQLLAPMLDRLEADPRAARDTGRSHRSGAERRYGG